MTALFEAKLTIKARTLESFYTPIDYFPGTTLDEVRYETGILTEAKGQPQSSIEDIWARKNVIAHNPMYTRAYHPQVLAPKLKYDALKDTTKDQELLIQGQGFVGTDIPGAEGMMYVIREKGTGSPVLVMSEMKHYVQGDDEYETSLEGGFAFVNPTEQLFNKMTASLAGAVQRIQAHGNQNPQLAQIHQ